MGPVIAFADSRIFGATSRYRTIPACNHELRPLIRSAREQILSAGRLRDAAHWFAQRGYAVIAPIGPSSIGGAFDLPERELYTRYFSPVGGCDDPYSLSGAIAWATANNWIIDYMTRERLITPNKVILAGQSAGGWAAIALSSLNPKSTRAIITFATSGRVDGKAENSCASRKLIEAAREFGRTSRIPMLWIHSSNDTYFGPELSKQVYEAFTSVGGIAEYHCFLHLAVTRRHCMPFRCGRLLSISFWISIKAS